MLELGVSNLFGRMMRSVGWMAFTLPLPFLVMVFYWLREPEEELDPFVRVHEFVHVRQDERFAFFPIRYLVALVTDGGYRQNRFELEAMRIESRARATGLPDWATTPTFDRP